MPVSNGSFLDLTCTAAELADGWVDNDTGEAVSEAVTNQPVADSVATAWKFDSKTSADTDDQAQREKTIGSIDALGNTIVISFKAYFDLLGVQADTDTFHCEFSRSDWRLVVDIATDGMFIGDTVGYIEVGTNIISLDNWLVITIEVDLSGGVESAVCDVWVNDVLKDSNVDCVKAGTADGYMYFRVRGFTTDDCISYIDYIKIGDGFAPSEFIPQIMVF